KRKKIRENLRSHPRNLREKKVRQVKPLDALGMDELQICS
ncbi:MAG: hypothetical protein RLZZ628_3277, partial [Bacteroidota bacterium]